MIVYKITNSINQKVYVGLDSSSSHRRWYYHRWAYAKTHVADYEKRLYRAFRKYGLSNFVYSVLEACSNWDHLVERERHYIIHLRSTEYQYGYNVHGNPARKGMPWKAYRAKSPDGSIYEILDMREFCEKHGLNKRRMYAIASGKDGSRYTAGWQCIRSGEEFSDPPAMIARPSGNRKGVVHRKKRTVNSKTKIWSLLDPDGTTLIITDLKSFCEENNLRYRCMLRVSSGERPHHKGWRVISAIPQHWDNNGSIV